MSRPPQQPTRPPGDTKGALYDALQGAVKSERAETPGATGATVGPGAAVPG